MLFQATIATTGVPQQISASTAGVASAIKQLTLQNNGTNVMRIGDSSVTASNGIKLAAGASITITFENLSQIANWYVVGTAADVLDALATS